MDNRLRLLREKVVQGYYEKYRYTESIDIQKERDCGDLSWEQQVSALFHEVVNREKPIIEQEERIVFTRTTRHPVNPIPQEVKNKKNCLGHRVHNICADWEMTLRDGLQGRRHAAGKAREQFAKDSPQYRYLNTVLDSLDSVEKLVKKYQDKACELKRWDIVAALQSIIDGKPKSFYHALQSLRFFQGVLWMNGHNHIGFGRFDQYMWPYLKKDLECNRLNIDKAEDLVSEFIISVNRDVGVYPGIQKGDNGQSLMLGGVTKNGERGDNPLTLIVLKVASELSLPDPKINLRIDKSTPQEILVRAAELIQKGMGFPQFSHDDVVIPSLVNNGYELEDARQYTVAACWEFIIPGKGMDVPNVNALSFPYEIDTAIRKGLKYKSSFNKIMQDVRKNIINRVALYVDHLKDICFWPPAPLYSALMTDCIERGLDINNGGAKYCNYGIHGSGCANAADALAALRYVVFDTGLADADTFLSALNNNWEGYEDLREFVLTKSPKVGNNDDRADRYLPFLFESFYEGCVKCSGILNKRGAKIGIRAGTGSAMYYVWLVKDCRPNSLEPVVKATADGRKEGEFISANLAPSIGVKSAGPISCMQSFSKIPYEYICNGGPITMELLPSCFKGKPGTIQIINLLKVFLWLNCQQLQLNMVCAEQLIEAKQNPDKYKNLIVRVWGWSARFVDLDEDFQNQIIQRSFFSSS